MNHKIRKKGWKSPVLLIVGLVVALSLSLTGCSRLNNLRGDGFHDNSLGETVRQSRPSQKKPQEFWSFSNKARQIEADFPDG
jgi:predicted small secreted protein